jgi:hypothetical protein
MVYEIRCYVKLPDYPLNLLRVLWIWIWITVGLLKCHRTLCYPLSQPSTSARSYCTIFMRKKCYIFFQKKKKKKKKIKKKIKFYKKNKIFYLKNMFGI